MLSHFRQLLRAQYVCGYCISIHPSLANNKRRKRISANEEIVCSDDPVLAGAPSNAV